MNLIALLIGLAIERLATHLFEWRRMRWLDRLIDAGFDRARKTTGLPPLVIVIGLVLLLALPVFIVTFTFDDTLYGFPYLFLAIVVLFFSLGPKDIGEDVDEYCDALQGDDEELIRQRAKSLIEDDPPADPDESLRAVESAVFVQANNRLFAVIFWFVVLGLFGPLGAWIFRVTDLVRRRAVFNVARSGDGDDSAYTGVRDAAVTLHGWLAWIPARLTAIGYAVAGHFDAALQAWRSPAGDESLSTFSASENLLARVGTAAMALHELPDESPTERAVRGATTAKKLVYRLLLIWAVVIAALTLYGWTV